MFRPKTIRRMKPEARKLARLINELESVATRLKNFHQGTLSDLEFKAALWDRYGEHAHEHGPDEQPDLGIDWVDNACDEDADSMGASEVYFEGDY